MFNDLPNNQKPAVDDIFAETDKPAAASAPSSSGQSPEIETQRVGLTSSGNNYTGEEREARPKNDRWFKIGVIFIVIVIIGLLAYLAYSKLAKPAPEDVPSQPTAPSVKQTPVVIPANEPATEAETDATTTVETPSLDIPAIPGINAPATSAPEIVLPPTDSDADGLTDEEETALGTNINIIDTDSDGLSDYEEANIYKTNPLNADSDGDTYSDGSEVRNGYNPNGPGKLPGLGD